MYFPLMSCVNLMYSRLYEMPECGRQHYINDPIQILAAAERGDYVAGCICGHSWQPSHAEQHLIAAEQRRLLTEL
jgi:hypothetical protein